VSDEDVVELTFDQALTVRVDVATGELRFEAGVVTDLSVPTLVRLPAEEATAIPEGPLDEEDKRVLNDPRVERALALLADSDDWVEEVAEAANESLADLVVKTRDTP
jgi:hypothetical protein